MRAALFDGVGRPLRFAEIERPPLPPGRIRIRVHACGVCRTDLHVVDGELPDPRLPLVLGHEIVGTVLETGEGVTGFARGDRVGVPWLGRTCDACRFCGSGRENLCLDPGFTGYTIDGGYADETVADPRYCFRIPDAYDDVHAAPLLCAGLIGFRAYRMAGEARRLGLYGFGAAAHILTQIAAGQGREIHAFTRPGDTAGQAFARSLGAVWAGGSDERPPDPLDAAILFAPVGALVPTALAAVDRGGIVVAAGIHMSPIPEFGYDLLWQERIVRSVANLTRADGEAFFAAVAETRPVIHVETHPLERAGEVLERLRAGRVQGAAVLVPNETETP